ncbi:unnamed protein product [Toxocara canis]|nr:unnamed protein product [Toxocara canis]
MGAERSAMNSAFSSPSSSVQSMSPNRKGANLLVGKTVRSISASPPLKPPIIHSGDGPYRGPTYNCRVLSPLRDGKPSENTDKSCKLLLPGFPADNSCRCTYDVSGRDENGCAMGYLYTCKKR